MAVLCSISPSSSTCHSLLPSASSSSSASASSLSRSLCRLRQFASPPASLRCRITRPIAALNVCPQDQETQRHRIDKSLVKVSEAVSEDELWAAACLRVRTFYALDQTTFRVQDHRRYLAEREFEALKERVAGKREGFRRVSCINATLPLSHVLNTSDDLCDSCKLHEKYADFVFIVKFSPEAYLLGSKLKFTESGEQRVVVGSLDLNNCHHLPDEIAGQKPEGIGADFARAYISNVCVAEELHRNGLAYALIAKSKTVAEKWGISDLYVHVAVNNIPAKNLYMKSGFIFESDEPAWQARFLDRPRRILLWTGLPVKYEL